MSLGKTLVAYESKSGATQEAAGKIAEILRSQFSIEVDLVDLGKQKIPNLQNYQNIVVGSGVRGGKIYDKAQKSLENDFSGKRFAFFVCAGGAAEAQNINKVKTQVIDATLAAYPNNTPAATEAFGGHFKILGKTVIDTFNIQKVEAWAQTLGETFSQ